MVKEFAFLTKNRGKNLNFFHAVPHVALATTSNPFLTEMAQRDVFDFATQSI